MCTSHALDPQRIIWPVSRAISPPKAENAAHVWHTLPLLRIRFYGQIREWETGSGFTTAVFPTPGGLARSRAHDRHTRAEEIGFYRSARGVFLITGIQ